MGFFNFVLVRLALIFAAGIAIGYHFPGPAVQLYLPAGPLLLGTYWWWSKGWIGPNPLFGVLAYVFVLMLGYHYVQAVAPQSNPHHLSTGSNGQVTALQVCVREVLRPGKRFTRYICEVREMNSTPASGRILVRFHRDSMRYTIGPDDMLLLAGITQPISPPANPHQFDYAAYMRTRHVGHQINVHSNNVECFSPEVRSLKGMAASLRSSLEKQLEDSGLTQGSAALVQALVLGNRDDLSRDRYREYARAGAVHMLAVSGLHVGIIFLILQYLLRPLSYFRFGYQIRFVILALILWAYAFLTGLSPSVTRAVAMFSCFALARLINRPTNSINNLFLSWLILLAWDPFLLFQPGFQLSYLALFFILWVQPALQRLYKPRFYLDKALWGMVTVSVAAQLGVTPLTLYYFHQFPGLFLLSNCTLLPFLGLMIGGGILLLALLLLGLRPTVLVKWYDIMLQTVNDWIGWIAAREGFLIEGVYLDGLQLLLCFFLAAVLALFIRRPVTGQLRLPILALLMLSAYGLYGQLRPAAQEIVVFQQYGKSLLAIRQGASLLVMKRDSLVYADLYPVQSYRLAKGIRHYSEEQLQNFLAFEDFNLVVVDSSGVYTGIPNANVLLVENPRINLDRLIDSICPKQIIADGSNYDWLVNRWRQTAQNRKLRFYHTGSSGALVLEQ